MSITRLQDPPPRAVKVTEPSGSFVIMWSGWFRRLTDIYNQNLAQGFSGTITLPSLTVGGTQGTITFDKGVLVNQVPST